MFAGEIHSLEANQIGARAQSCSVRNVLPVTAARPRESEKLLR
jgi:hypothetical protein